MNEKFKVIALIVVAAWLFAGCTMIDTLFGTPTPTPTPTPSPTPLPTPTPTPTIAPPQLRCPASCEDGNPCTTDDCGARTEFQCEHLPLTGEQGNCSGSAGNCTNRTCINGVCGTAPVTPCCGNGACEQGEGCTCLDCTCGQGELCCNNTCRAPACTLDSGCNDASLCTRDSCSNPGTCDAVCVNQQKDCLNFDNCCPVGCDFLTDNDCPAHSKGQWANTSTNISIRVDDLLTRVCTVNASGQEKKWVALRLTLKYNRAGSAYFTPTYVTLVDDYIGATLTRSDPTGTDCYPRDVDFFLNAGNVYNEEKVGLIYFSYADKTLSSQTKKIVINVGSGPRLVWLIAPSG